MQTAEHGQSEGPQRLSALAVGSLLDHISQHEQPISRLLDLAEQQLPGVKPLLSQLSDPAPLEWTAACTAALLQCYKEEVVQVALASAMSIRCRCRA